MCPRTPHLEIRFKDLYDLGAGRSEDCDRLNWQVSSLEAQLSDSGRRDHGGDGLRVLVLVLGNH